MVVKNYGKLLSLLALAFTVVTAGYAADAEHGRHKKSDVGSLQPSEQVARTPSAVFDRSGRLWLAWAYGWHVYVNYSDDFGATFSVPVVVNNQPENIYSNGEARPKIAVDDSDRVYVAYTQKLEKRFTGHIRFSRSLDRGQSFGAPVTVNDNSEIISHRFVSMSLDQDNRIHLLWLDGRDHEAAKRAHQDYLASSLYYSYSDDHGLNFSKNVKLADHACQCCRIAAAIDAQQRLVVLWRHVFQEVTAQGARMSRDHALLTVAAAGNVSSLQRISFENWAIDTCPHHGPALGIGSGNRYHMSWFNHQGGQAGLYYAYTDNSGKTMQARINFASGATQAQHPYVASVGDVVVLAWKTFDGQRSRVMAIRSADGGKSWGKPRELLDSAAESDHPLLLAYQQKLFLSWHTQDHGYRLLELPAW